ncbi:hypothetical protein [Roseivirga sp. E12]|uniref:hypothetical protein n=1 Tax=Roseivirga sp. E12 TaxID=2819237 RepID=UPI001ABD3758|nr:hypothetical protein [Roseivirga sp. E12]MBO3700642.1 hypothetical protein [Roseivirga sp. E12]
MDFDFSTALYLILGIIYFIFSGVKKKNQRDKNQPQRGRTSNPETVGPPPVSRKPSFEELLEEFTGQKTVQPEPQPEPIAPIVTPPTNVYENPKPVTEVLTKKENQPLVSFKEYELDSVEDQEDYREMFSSLDDAKRAFVASEVFSRKY